MASALKTNTSPMTRLTDESIEFSLGKRKFLLNEMKIGRTKKFIRLISDTFDQLRSSFLQEGGDSALQQLEISAVIDKYGDVAFEKIAGLFNFCFEYLNEDYEPVDGAWVADNLSIREMGMVLQEVLKMNKLEWLLPFFRDAFLAEAKRVKSQME